MLTALLVLAAVAWVASGNHALQRHRKIARQLDSEWSDCYPESGDRVCVTLFGPFTYLISHSAINERKRVLKCGASLPGQIETEKRLLDDLQGVRKCLAIQAEKIAAAKALAEGSEDPAHKHTAPLRAEDLESACDIWQELKDKEADLDDRLDATRLKIAELRGLYGGLIEANGITEGELEEAVKLLPAPAETPASPQEQPPAAQSDEDAAMLAKLGDPGSAVLRRLLLHKNDSRINVKCNGQCWGGNATNKIDNVPLLLMDVLPFLSPRYFPYKRGEFGSWLMTEYGDHRLGMAVGQSTTPVEAAKYIEWRLKQAMDMLEQNGTAPTPAPPPAAEFDDDFNPPSGS
jgi:hypothetical protein